MNPTSSPRLALIAVGGNSLIQDPRYPDIPHQWEAVRATAASIAALIADGWTTVITHGNGPQVGYILRKNELSAHEIYTAPLDIISSNTQGAIGYMLQQALSNEFIHLGIERTCVSLITLTMVEADDPAFAKPSKPIGGFMDEATARRFEQEGWQVMEDAGRGWRRVVASPEPQVILEAPAIEQGVSLGWTVIAAGGGGIPVVRNRQGELRGMLAVIDKDKASSLLASRLAADLFLISTGVEQVALHFGKPNQQALTTITLAEAKQYLDQGHFAAGSMRPKIEACIRYLESCSNPNATALISNPENLVAAVAGRTGTRIVRQ
jgi:carbamate kinase